MQAFAKKATTHKPGTFSHQYYFHPQTAECVLRVLVKQVELGNTTQTSLAKGVSGDNERPADYSYKSHSHNTVYLTCIAPLQIVHTYSRIG